MCVWVMFTVRAIRLLFVVVFRSHFDCSAYLASDKEGGDVAGVSPEGPETFGPDPRAIGSSKLLSEPIAGLRMCVARLCAIELSEAAVMASAL